MWTVYVMLSVDNIYQCIIKCNFNPKHFNSVIIYMFQTCIIVFKYNETQWSQEQDNTEPHWLRLSWEIKTFNTGFERHVNDELLGELSLQRTFNTKTDKIACLTLLFVRQSHPDFIDVNSW